MPAIFFSSLQNSVYTVAQLDRRRTEIQRCSLRNFSPQQGPGWNQAGMSLPQCKAHHPNPFFKPPIKNESRSVVSDCDPMDYTVHGNFPDQNTGVGSLSLLHGIFPTQRSNPGLRHCRQLPYQLSHQGSTLFITLHLLVCQL